jgi:hypothetical protein
MPEGWLEDAETTATIEFFSDLLERRLEASDGIWAFKEPVTAKLLPMWQLIFRRLRLSPRYVLCLRDPASTIRSFRTAYDHPEEITELLWLSRTADAIRYTGGRLQVVQYEQMLKNSVGEASKLASFVGLSVTVEQLEAVAEKFVEARLATATDTDYRPRNPRVGQLYQALQQFDSAPDQASSLVTMAEEIDAYLSAKTAQIVSTDFLGARLHKETERYGASIKKTHRLEKELSQARASLLALQRDYDALHASHRSLLNSRSWKLTRPLRRIASEVRKRLPAS